MDEGRKILESIEEVSKEEVKIEDANTEEVKIEEVKIEDAKDDETPNNKSNGFLFSKKKLIISAASLLGVLVLIVVIYSFYGNRNDNTGKDNASGNSMKIVENSDIPLSTESAWQVNVPTASSSALPGVTQNNQASQSPVPTGILNSPSTGATLSANGGTSSGTYDSTNGSTNGSTNSLTNNTTVNPNSKKVTFKFYSSTASNVYLAGPMNDWSPTATRMTKNGNWFSVTMDLEKSTLYKFVADGSWMIDSLNTTVRTSDADNSYLDISSKSVNVDSSIKIYSSTHFDYFTENGKNKTADLETIYSALMSNLNYMSPKTVKKKIRYYGIDYVSDKNYSPMNYEAPFAMPDTSEVYDLWDCNSAHEIVHTLVRVYNEFFNEGFANCYQREGNSTMKWQNATLSVKDTILSRGSSGFFELLGDSITVAPNNYYIPSSFIFYNVKVLNKKTAFAKFAKSLTASDSVSSIKTKYKTAMGTDLTTAVSNWEEWVLSVDEDSNIYMIW